MRIINAIMNLINYIISLFTKPEPNPVPPEPQPNPEPKPPVPPNPDDIIVIDYDKELLEAHNKLRKSPLIINHKLTDAAINHAIWMVKNNRMSHTANGGMTKRVRDTGYSYSGIAENIAPSYYTTVESVMSAWKNSGGHYRNITGNYKDVGFGVASKNGKIFWCVVFGNPR